jgi:hypothetical protein
VTVARQMGWSVYLATVILTITCHRSVVVLVVVLLDNHTQRASGHDTLDQYVVVSMPQRNMESLPNPLLGCQATDRYELNTYLS